jgi:hypothetical protein
MNVLVVMTLLLGQQDEAVALGKRTFTSRCTNCHFVPDTTLRTDRAWLAMVKTTA